MRRSLSVNLAFFSCPHILPPSHLILAFFSYSSWLAAGQKTIIILHASLSEEATTHVVGLSSAREIWVALEAAYGNSSIERVHTFRDQLRLLSKGSKSVAEFGREFKALFDNLSAIGHPVNGDDQLHWFVCGLGPTFENFSTAVRSTHPPPVLADLIARAESHELFLLNLHRNTSPTIAFHAENTSLNTTNRVVVVDSVDPAVVAVVGDAHPPASSADLLATLLRQLSSFATSATTCPLSDDKLAQTFTAQCNFSSSGPDWFMDSGASDHMTNTPDLVSNLSPTPGSGHQAGTSSGKCEAGLYVLHSGRHALVANINNNKCPKSSFEL